MSETKHLGSFNNKLEDYLAQRRAAGQGDNSDEITLKILTKAALRKSANTQRGMFGVSIPFLVVVRCASR